MTPPSPPLAGKRALFVSWVGHHGRSEDLALALGAECRFIAIGTLRNRASAPFRHLWQSIVTLGVLMSKRPRVLFVMAPPAALVLLALGWSRLTRCQLIVDCHSGAVLGRPMSARLADKASLCLVTTPALAAGFRHAIAVHDPPATTVTAPRHDELVFPASWAPDEPIAALLAAARLLPHVRFAVTGRAPTGLDVPPNVRLTGYLGPTDYLALVAGAPVVLALTEREDTMQRAAYEAVAAGRPVVASDTAALRSYLADAAVYAGDLTEAIRGALVRVPELERAMQRVREEQGLAFSRALAEIARAVA